VSARDVVFLAIAGLTCVSAVLAVTSSRVLHAALWLVVTLGSVAACYLLLGAELVALVSADMGKTLADADGEVGRGEQARAVLLDAKRLGTFTMEVKPDLLEVQDDVAHVLHHAWNRREFVEDSIDPHRRDRGSLERGQQYPAQCVPERHTETAFQRFARKTTV